MKDIVKSKGRVKKNIWKIPYPRGEGLVRVIFHFNFFLVPNGLKINFGN